MLEARPGLRSELRPEHHLMLHRPAESGNAAVLETMLACGFEPDARDKDNVTPLHRAAMGGHPDAVRVLLKFGADVNALDGMFSATPLVWAVEGRSNSKHAGADFVEVAQAPDRRGLAARVDAARGRTGTRADLGRIDGVEAVGRSCSDDVTVCPSRSLARSSSS